MSYGAQQVLGSDAKKCYRNRMDKSVFQAKIDRLAAGGNPRVLDLFAGCGGLSLGFDRAGFAIAGAVENDPIAARSHARNFHRDCEGDLFEAHATARDIVKEDPCLLAQEFGYTEAQKAFDVIVGGPPCQAFARVGRSKLREIADHPEAFIHDDRAKLYIRYLDYIEALKPLALLVENVPDVLNHGGQNVAHEMCDVLSSLGYTCGYTLLNSAYYGVPQMRERMFLIAYRKELAATVVFPNPTHWVDLPDGYKGSRNVALKSINTSEGDGDLYYQAPPSAHNKLPPAVTASEATADLPSITLHLEGKLKRGARRFNTLIPYNSRKKLTSYAEEMKTWPGFENEKGIYDHVIRYLPRDYAIFKRMKPGDQYPEAHRLALKMLSEAAQEQGIAEGGDEYEVLKKSIVPPYDPGKFPNKWRKMEPDKPSRTLMAHLGKDSYSHIHYDSRQARTISVREAARLQSFPDGFLFEGTMNPAFRQIGNAVPPLMAKALATEIHKVLSKAVNHIGVDYGTRRQAEAV